MSLPPKTDVLIIGAGPAGASAALFLSKHNIACTIIDKAKFPRDKICGDALSGKTVEILNRIDKNLVQEMASDSKFTDSHGVVFTAPNGKSLRVPFVMKKESTVPPGFIARRWDFDNFLVDKIKSDPNISLVENTEIRHYEKREDSMLATTTEGKDISTKLILAADGVHSSFAKDEAHLLLEPKHHCFGLRAYYKGVRNLDKQHFIELHFLKEILPCYFWIFPLPNGMANVGIGIRADQAKKRNIKLKQTFDRVMNENAAIRSRFEKAELIGDIKLASLPLGTKRRSISGYRFMLCGDAAQLVDPFTGEGIGNAMLSGMLAAAQVKRCLTSNSFDASFMQQYDQELYRRLWPELQLSTRLCTLVNFPGLFNMVVHKANDNPIIGETISHMFNDLDIRSRLKSPSFYWKLLFS